MTDRKIDRKAFAVEHDMTMDFVNWFFDYKKNGCGNAWFIMSAAMWEGWQAAIASQQPRDDGWIEWDVGDMPKHVRGFTVQVRYANGKTETGYSSFFNWGYGAGELVVAYRVLDL